jgi:phosphoribosyl 1,2-cyclic phosphodiesterase
MAVRVEVLGSGSKGNCTFVSGGRTRILVDAGFSCVEIERRLRSIGEDPGTLDAVAITHEHSDHLGGAAVLSRRHGVPLACAEETLVAGGLDRAQIAEWVTVVPGQPFEIGDLYLEPFSVPHDAALTLAYRIRAEGLSIAYCTDLGHVTHLVRERLRSAHVLVLESNHDIDLLRDGPYPWPLKQRVGGKHGHLSNDAACHLLADVVDEQALVVALAHLSETNNAPELAGHGARAALDAAGREAVRLVVTSQRRPSHVAIA